MQARGLSIVLGVACSIFKYQPSKGGAGACQGLGDGKVKGCAVRINTRGSIAGSECQGLGLREVSEMGTAEGRWALLKHGKRMISLTHSSSASLLGFREGRQIVSQHETD